MRSNICDVECSDGGSDSDSNGRRDLLTSAGQNGRRMQRRDARQAVEVGRVQGENIGVEQVRGHR